MFGVYEAIVLVECIIIVILVVVIIALAVSAKKHKELQAEAASLEGATLPAEVEQQQFDASADY